MLSAFYCCCSFFINHDPEEDFVVFMNACFCFFSGRNNQHCDSAAATFRSKRSRVEVKMLLGSSLKSQEISATPTLIFLFKATASLGLI